MYATGANKSPASVPTVKQLPKGFTGMATISQIQLTGQMGIDALSAGVVISLIALTEAVAIARTFAAYKGYHIDGNKEVRWRTRWQLGGAGDPDCWDVWP